MKGIAEPSYLEMWVIVSSVVCEASTLAEVSLYSYHLPLCWVLMSEFLCFSALQEVRIPPGPRLLILHHLEQCRIGARNPARQKAVMPTQTPPVALKQWNRIHCQRAISNDGACGGHCFENSVALRLGVVASLQCKQHCRIWYHRSQWREIGSSCSSEWIPVAVTGDTTSQSLLKNPAASLH